MKMVLGRRILSLIFLSFFSVSSFAWDHGIAIGYGSGSDINHHTDTNSGAFLTAKMLSLSKRDWYNFTFDGSLGKWLSDAPFNRDLVTAALSFDFRAYVFNRTKAHPYLYASAGPAYLSHRRFGRNTQGANFAFQSAVGVGVEVGQKGRVDLGFNFVHFSNAYLIKPNEGFNFLYVFTVGVLF